MFGTRPPWTDGVSVTLSQVRTAGAAEVLEPELVSLLLWSAIRKPSTLTVCRQPAPMERALWLRFDADVVVHGSANPLLAAEIAFGCLHGDVAEKELDLIQFSTRCMA